MSRVRPRGRRRGRAPRAASRAAAGPSRGRAGRAARPAPAARRGRGAADDQLGDGQELGHQRREPAAPADDALEPGERRDVRHQDGGQQQVRRERQRIGRRPARGTAGADGTGVGEPAAAAACRTAARIACWTSGGGSSTSDGRTSASRSRSQAGGRFVHQLPVHQQAPAATASSAGRSSTARRSLPRRMWLLTVLSGTPMTSAMSS